MQKNSIAVEQSSSSSKRYVQRHLTVIGIIFCFTILAIFFGFNSRANFLIQQQFLKEARAYSQEITLMRQWIANHGGIYVEKRSGVSVSPYLKKISPFKTTIQDQDRKQYVLKNPATVTREISEMAKEERFFSFHITSLEPINPLNKPDQFEAQSLREFRLGQKEAYLFDNNSDEIIFRYISPLTVKESCLACHAAQGYEVGDIRGGISVSIPASDIINQIKRSKIHIISFALIVLVILTTIILFISTHLIKNLKQAEQKLMEMAPRDFLTGLLNRREGMNRFKEEISKSKRKQLPLSAVLLDIDHFKIINDTHGHLAGDRILQNLAETLKITMRDYDIICRYGGEEFLLVLPDTELLKAVDIANRLRNEVAALEYVIDSQITIGMTISLGVAQLTGNEEENSLIFRVDQALYMAKENGRNRVRFQEKQ
jgi:diguanylate cyclase (GGDEF)-like protein